MSELVDPREIERIVGAKRHPTEHIARVVESENMVYILHSQECVAQVPDRRDCPFSLALDRGFDREVWGDIDEGPWFIDISGAYQTLAPTGRVDLNPKKPTINNKGNIVTNQAFAPQEIADALREAADWIDSHQPDTLFTTTEAKGQGLCLSMQLDGNAEIAGLDLDAARKVSDSPEMAWRTILGFGWGRRRVTTVAAYRFPLILELVGLREFRVALREDGEVA